MHFSFLGYRSNGVKLDIWYNIKSKHIEKLYDDPRYPENPDYTLELSTFDYYRLSNQYGSRLSAVYEVNNFYIRVKQKNIFHKIDAAKLIILQKHTFLLHISHD